MKNLEIKVDDSGNLQSVYDDSLNDMYKALGTTKIERASDVEYERKGWTVRSHKDPTKALRIVRGVVTVSKKGPLAYFESREAGIQAELKNFWTLI